MVLSDEQGRIRDFPLLFLRESDRVSMEYTVQSQRRISMRLFCVYILLLFLGCGCCIQVPELSKDENSSQKIMQVSTDWEMLATDLANRINNQLIITGNIDKAVFVKETCGDENLACQPNETSSFNEAFHDLLVTHIFGYGVPTESQPDENAIEVRYKVQVVHYSTDRVDSEKVSSNCEVVITTSMVTKGQYIFRSSNIYYINEKDYFQYQENLPRTKTIKLSKGKLVDPTQSLEISSATTVYKPNPVANFGYKADAKRTTT
jgi:hypothetical protein